jgi:iron-sulfur cluster repair protein YtfE (RIC family)
MKRHDALASLSRDHHHGLVVAQKLSRATETDALAARAALLAFWEQEGYEHLRIEEDLLFPAFARQADPTHDAIVRVLTEHVDLRRRAADLTAQTAPAPDALHDLGGRLHDHIRHEERVLFPLIEAALPEHELLELAAAVERAHASQ